MDNRGVSGGRNGNNRQKETELVQSLTEKYGPGSLNPQTGEYTPVSAEETKNN